MVTTNKTFKCECESCGVKSFEHKYTSSPELCRLEEAVGREEWPGDCPGGQVSWQSVPGWGRPWGWCAISRCGRDQAWRGRWGRGRSRRRENSACSRSGSTAPSGRMSWTSEIMDGWRIWKEQLRKFLTVADMEVRLLFDKLMVTSRVRSAKVVSETELRRQLVKERSVRCRRLEEAKLAPRSWRRWLPSITRTWKEEFVGLWFRTKGRGCRKEMLERNLQLGAKVIRDSL